MRVLVTGGTGQVGRALVASAPGHIDVVAPPRDRLDLADTRSIADYLGAERFDLIVNSGAYTAVDLAEREQVLADRVNHLAVKAIAEAAGDARLVQISTDFVFDGSSGRPYRPEDATFPLGAYGRTKRDGEKAALMRADTLVVRTSWVYAAAGKNFVNTMLKLIAERDEVRVVADQVGTPTHAASLARAIWALAGATLPECRVAHWTDAGVASWYDFAVAIREEALAIGLLARAAIVVPIRTEDYPTPAERPNYSVLDKTTAFGQLGPARHWRDELRACLGQMAPPQVGQ